MVTELDKKSLELLSYVHDHPDELLDKVMADLELDSDSLLRYLHSHGYAEQPVCGYEHGEPLYWNRYHITPKGNAVLENVKAENASRRSGWLRWVVDAFLVIVTALITWFAAKR